MAAAAPAAVLTKQYRLAGSANWEHQSNVSTTLLFAARNVIGGLGEPNGDGVNVATNAAVPTTTTIDNLGGITVRVQYKGRNPNPNGQVDIEFHA